MSIYQGWFVNMVKDSVGFSCLRFKYWQSANSAGQALYCACTFHKLNFSPLQMPWFEISQVVETANSHRIHMSPNRCLFQLIMYMFSFYSLFYICIMKYFQVISQILHLSMLFEAVTSTVWWEIHEVVMNNMLPTPNYIYRPSLWCNIYGGTFFFLHMFRKCSAVFAGPTWKDERSESH